MDPSAATQQERPMPTAARPLRVVVLLHTALILAQAAFAGQFLAGDGAWVRVHEANAGIIHMVGFFQLVLAVLVWRPGRGPGWPALASLALLLAEELQLGFGYARILALHVPLGVAIFGLAVAILVGTRRLTRVEPEPRAQPHATSRTSAPPRSAS
jgi:hypothetical protein